MNANIEYIKSLFTIAKVTGSVKVSKHQASKKNAKHPNHRASLGELRHAEYLLKIEAAK